MKRTLITYTFGLDADAERAWHDRVARFIADIDADPELRGRIKYHCMRQKDGAYVHLAEVVDDGATAALTSRPFFRAYADETKRVARDHDVRVVALETIAETR